MAGNYKVEDNMSERKPTLRKCRESVAPFRAMCVLWEGHTGAHTLTSRTPINIDPEIRDALRRHLMSPKYMGTGVGYSEFIRRALIADGADHVPERVTPDNRWSGTYEPDDSINGPR
jgi:hypothetical protein